MTDDLRELLCGAPGADGGDELRDVTRVAQRLAGARFDAAQPVADGVGMAEQQRAGGGGGAAGPHPGLEGAQGATAVRADND